MSHFYDKKGEPIDMNEWIEKMEDHNYRVLWQDTLDNGIWVSTIWLGISTNGTGNDIFETIAFIVKQGEDLLIERVGTIEEALETHKNVILKFIDCNIKDLLEENNINE